MARSTVYSRRDKEQRDPETPPKRRGPRAACPDEELVEKIRKVLKESPWKGEGYRKVWARLRFQGIRVSQKRVLRLMRENGLLAKDRPVPFSADCLGIHAARFGTPFEPLVPFRQAIRTIFGDFKEGIAEGEDFLLRHDHGSRFVSHVYQAEIRFVGVTSSPAYVREPETNRCAERFVRTLKEQLPWVRKFDTIEELNQALQQFMHDYNNSWILQRHGYLTPAQAWLKALKKEGVAA